VDRTRRHHLAPLRCYFNSGVTALHGSFRELRRLRGVLDAMPRELLAIQLREHQVRIARGKIEATVGEVIRKPSLGFVMLARAEGAVVGVAYVSHQWTLEYGGLTAWLEELYVIPEWRNRGVGRRLLRCVIDHASRIGCAAVDLEVEREHRRSEHLYERMGFRRYDRARWAKRLRPA
jgi:GNAT superfamily N-acetyltransferase